MGDGDFKRQHLSCATEKREKKEWDWKRQEKRVREGKPAHGSLVSRPKKKVLALCTPAQSTADRSNNRDSDVRSEKLD